jgi:hypothetical protein
MRVASSDSLGRWKITSRRRVRSSEMSESEHEEQPQEPEAADAAVEEDDEDAVEAHMPGGSVQPDLGA